jgi:hypothetical protein
MFKHHLKVAFRNLWKYKNQTLISVIGLATGFACFAIAALWLRYEMTFDSFHKNSGRLYFVSIKYGEMMEDYEVFTTGLLLLDSYMKNTFPEVKNATNIVHRIHDAEFDELTSEVDVILTDSAFLKIFDIRILEGNSDFLIPESKQVAITREKAQQLFGNNSPIGKTVKVLGHHTIGAVVSGFEKQSNYPFDILTGYDPYAFIGGALIVELHPKTNLKSLVQKLYSHKGNVECKRYSMMSYSEAGIVGAGDIISDMQDFEKIVLTPITSIRFENPYIYRLVKLQHVIIFAVAGSLLILCTLLNYLMLFAGRFRIRQRELALRIVCGASNRSLFTLLSVEFLMSLAVSLLLGGLIIQAIIPYFIRLSHVEMKLLIIYIESLIYIVSIILISLLVFLLVLAVFRRQALNVSIRGGNKKIFRKVSIVIQLLISINFTFCTVIMLKQMYFLHNTDLGFDLKHVGSVQMGRQNMDAASLEDKLKQIPEITATLKGHSQITFWTGEGDGFCDWEGCPDDKKNVKITIRHTSPEIADFYKFRLVSGEMLAESDGKEYVLINEFAAQALGLYEPAGKILKFEYEHYIVKGVIKNIYNGSPTDPVKPTMYKRSAYYHPAYSVMFKYRAGTWKTCRDKITRLIGEKDTEFGDIIIVNEEDQFDESHLQSENILFRILTVVSLICVIVCIFGFVSTVSLTCEERRKEIAIRKINGATVKDILDIFFKEYLTLLAIGALTAFPVGYIIMKRWLENYVLQTEMSAWIYLSILLALIAVIVLCVGGRVYKTSRENPVNAIK